MNMSLYARDFTGTGIKTPFDQMRANAIINARHDVSGMSVINFNINAFLQKARHDEIYYILNLWAIEPIKRNPEKFKKYTDFGKRALQKRAEILRRNFEKAPQIHDWFIDTAMSSISEAIEQEIGSIHSGGNTTRVNTA